MEEYTQKELTKKLKGKKTGDAEEPVIRKCPGYKKGFLLPFFKNKNSKLF